MGSLSILDSIVYSKTKFEVVALNNLKLWKLLVAAMLDKGLSVFKHCCIELFLDLIQFARRDKHGTRGEKKGSRPPGKESSSRLINPNGPTL